MKSSEGIKLDGVACVPPYSERPTYAAAFRCIGSSCEDTCCGDWDIPLDSRTYAKYQQFPAERLGAGVSEFVFVNAPGQPDALYAQIYRGTSGFCPFFGADRLCGVQREYGEQLLSATCSIYPRSFSFVAGALEGSLSLSCPEAARNVLLDPDFMQIKGDLFSGAFRTDNFFQLASGSSDSFCKPHGYFFAIRTLLMKMVRDRSRPMGQRLLLIGSLCKRLHESVLAEGEEIVPAILREYREILEGRGVEPEVECLPRDPRLRLEVIFELTDARIREGCGRRFQDTFLDVRGRDQRF
ncbi:flagellin lysine-N-methylase [Granulicella sp. dw_53]|uniref:flagellin lysine-N-methylase n=1 Tax=Granulicella sp. dw_53 TaxID=2719792 RepID=UPI001BD24E50|nr:flagellin lysine-N-methylase [Granulicella sp. dw_53]